MHVTNKSKKIGNNRTDAEKKENIPSILPNKITNHNNLIKEGGAAIISNKQRRIQRYSLKNNFDFEESDTFSNICKTTRENYTTKNEIEIFQTNRNLDEDRNNPIFEKFKIKQKEFKEIYCEDNKVLKKAKSFDDFVNRRHKEKILNNMTNKKKTYTLNLISGKIFNSIYAIYSNFVNSKFSREYNARESIIPNKYSKKRVKGNFMSTDLTSSNMTNNLVYTSNIKIANGKLPNNSNNPKLNPQMQNPIKSNIQKLDKTNFFNKPKKENDAKPANLEKIISPLENVESTHIKQSNVNIWEKKKLNQIQYLTMKNPSKISHKIQNPTPNMIDNSNNKSSNNNLPQQKEQDLFNKLLGNTNIPGKNNIINNSGKKISLRKISTNSIKTENENTVANKNSNNNKRINEINVLNSNFNLNNKIKSKNTLGNLITEVNTPENTFHSKSPIGKIKPRDSNEKSQKKKDLYNVASKLKEFRDIPKFSLNDKLAEKAESSTIKNFGISTEIEKTVTTPNLSTELTDKTLKGIKKEEELSPFKIYQIERIDDHLDNISNKLIINSPIEKNENFENPSNKTIKNFNQLSSLEKIISNNLNYLNQIPKSNITTKSPPQQMAKTKKFSYTDLTPMYSTNNQSKLKITDDFLKLIDNKKIVEDDLKKTFLHFGEDLNVEKNFKEKIENCDITSLINHSSDEYDCSSSERDDALDEIKQTKINNPLISKIKKNSFAINFIDDEYRFPEDEKKQTTIVPHFRSNKLTMFANSNLNFEKNTNNQNISLEKVFDLYILKNSKLKESLLSFLKVKDVTNLSFCNKLFRKQFKILLIDKITKTILTNDKKEFHQKVWKSIFNYSKLSSVKYLRKEFLDHLYQKSNYEEEIRKDLPRTIPEDPTFQPGKENYKKLFNILFAYSNYNKKIGYAQGINFIIANSLYIFQKEEEAFVFIDAMVNKLNLNDLIGINEIAIKHKLETVGKLIDKHTPKIAKFLSKNFLNHEFFTTGWIIPLFSNSISKEILFKLWDFLFIYGWNFLNYFIISILSNFEKNILEADPNKLSMFIKNLLKSEQFEKSFSKIILKTFELLNHTII